MDLYPQLIRVRGLLSEGARNMMEEEAQGEHEERGELR